MPNDWGNRFEKRPGITVFQGIIFALIGLGLIGGGIWVVRMVLYPVQQAGRIYEKTLDADNVIYNYEWFKRQHADILGMDTKVTAAKAAQTAFEKSAGARENWGFEDKQEWNRLNTVHLGLVGQRTSMIAEYNSKSSMANRSMFKDGDLPDSIIDPSATQN